MKVLILGYSNIVRKRVLSFLKDRLLSRCSYYSVKFIDKAKLVIELQKLQYDLKNKYQSLGKYVSDLELDKSLANFSHDEIFLKKVEGIKKIKLYINILKK